jgi:hypothetical protein
MWDGRAAASAQAEDDHDRRDIAESTPHSIEPAVKEVFFERLIVFSHQRRHEHKTSRRHRRQRPTA